MSQIKFTKKKRDSMKSVLIIYNSKSGADNKNELVAELKTFLIQQGFSKEKVTCLEPQSIEEAVAIAKDASLKKTDLIIAMGGDGTLNKIAGGIYAGGGHSVLGILPSGSVNNFAKALKIPIDRKAAMTNLITGQAKAVDLCRVNDKTMISSLTLGFLADMAAGVTSQDKRKFGKLAFLKDFWRVLKQNRSYKLRLLYNGGVHQIRTKILLITLTNAIAGITDFNPKASVDDGLIRCYYVDNLRLWKILLNLRHIRHGQFQQLSDISYFETNQLTIQATSKKHNPATRIDGDKSDQLPITLTVLPKAIKIMMP